MMYQDKLAIAVKSNGKVLREFKDTAFVPFGSEYSIFIKNLNSVRVRVSISIDGKDVADGDSFIINANSSMELERFLKNGNMSKGNRFKFIERTANVEAHRGGAQAEDGIIRVEYEFERENVPVPNYFGVPTPYPVPVWPKPYKPWYYGDIYYGVGTINASNQSINTLHDGHAATCSVNMANASVGASAQACSFTSTSSAPMGGSSSVGGSSVRARGITKSASPAAFSAPKADAIVNEAGITAAGSVSNQQFHTVSDIQGDGVKHAMVIRLLGEFGQAKITKPVTVKSKAKCTSCGRNNKATAKFCAECGTSLEII
jgi:hypothetical protein